MRYAIAKIALVATVFMAFASDASAQWRGRRGGFNSNNAAWYSPGNSYRWSYPSTYSGWNYPVNYGYTTNYGLGRYRTYYTTPTYSYYSTPTYSYSTTPGTVITSDTGVTQTSFYESSDARKALLTVSLPTSDAQVWLNGTMMSSQGFERNYSSPPLDFGTNYTYSVKAQWTIDGKPFEQMRDVAVRAGQRSSVDFRQSATTTTAPVPVPLQSK